MPKFGKNVFVILNVDSLKMKKEYDFVYLTNTPSFYKLNLCNEIARIRSVLIVLLGYGSEAVNTMLSESSRMRCDFVFLNEGEYTERNRIKVFVRLCKLMHKISYKKILYSGWMNVEFNLYSFFSPRQKNVLVCESSVFDTNFDGVKGWIKRRIVGRMRAVLPSGKPHAQLFEEIGFDGECNITGSVGIFNKGERRLKKDTTLKPLRYLYVGRLVDVKNIELLINVFNCNGLPLTIVGDGELRDKLKATANPNIHFIGFVNNEELGAVYQSHDIFILPSYYEPWGLVVEEALYWGLPVIVSDKVGSSIDMVKDLGTGLIFKSRDADSLQECIDRMEQKYDRFREAVMKIDWERRDADQVKAYTDLIPR